MYIHVYLIPYDYLSWKWWNRIHKSNLSFFVGTGMFDLLVISFFIGTTSISHHHCQESPPSPSSESITANNYITWYSWCKWTNHYIPWQVSMRSLIIGIYSNWFVYCTAHLNKMRLKPTGRSVGWSLSGVLPFPSAFILGVLFFLSFPD